MKRVSVFAISALMLFTVASCGGNSNTESTTPPADTAATTESTAPTQPPAVAPGTLELSAGDDMKYDLTELHAKAGTEVTLILHHTGTMKKEVMGHNFVLLKKGSDVNAFGKAAATSTTPDHIPDALKGEVIAHTDVIGGGETTQITFKAPTETGEYPFLCSFPGHYLAMQGKFIVE